MPTPKLQGPLPKRLPKVLDSVIAEVVSRSKTISAAARELDIARMTVHRSLSKYGYPEVSPEECFVRARAYENQQLRLALLSKFTNEQLLAQMRAIK